MLTVKQAVRRAIQTAQKFFSNQKLVDLALEEVEMTEDEKHWLITLGFYVPNVNPPAGIAAMIQQGHKYERKYKVFKVNADTSKVVSMKIREHI